MLKIKYFIQQSWLLIFCSFFFGLMIAAANAAWSGRIEQNKTDKLSNLMKGLITQAETFEVTIKDVPVPSDKGVQSVTDIYKAIDKAGKTVGFAFIASGMGFGDNIELVIAVDSGCRQLFGYKVLVCSETPGFGDRIKGEFFSSQFKGAPIGKFQLTKTGDASKIDDTIVAISGATVTSTAMVSIFNRYIDVVKQHLQDKGLIGDGK
jgi:electron transport complex protein RnfG